ncbi:hypothetical protein LBMAG42_51760 [Deltaproteobacteria bacterium]|nr:hypothetical protein LBMAG42_51760 [Deltaproteobacteria bacterium]
MHPARSRSPSRAAGIVLALALSASIATSPQDESRPIRGRLPTVSVATVVNADIFVAPYKCGQHVGSQPESWRLLELFRSSVVLPNGDIEPLEVTTEARSNTKLSKWARELVTTRHSCKDVSRPRILLVVSPGDAGAAAVLLEHTLEEAGLSGVLWSFWVEAVDTRPPGPGTDAALIHTAEPKRAWVIAPTVDGWTTTSGGAPDAGPFTDLAAAAAAVAAQPEHAVSLDMPEGTSWAERLDAAGIVAAQDQPARLRQVEGARAPAPPDFEDGASVERRLWSNARIKVVNAEIDTRLVVTPQPGEAAPP